MSAEDHDESAWPPALRRLIPRTAAQSWRTSRHRPSVGGPVPHGADDREDVLVDCALYVSGRRTGSVPTIDALRRAREVGGFVWVGLRQPTAAEFGAVATRFGLPPLAVEDAVRAHQRPKFEQYGEITFAVVKPVRYVDHVEMVDVSELAVFVGPDFVVSVRHGASQIPAEVRAELEAEPDALAAGPAAVLHRIVDRVVDGYADVIAAINVDIDEIEEQVFGGDETDHAQRIYKLKREVLEFRRAVVPLTGPLEQLATRDTPGVSAELRIYFRDVYDHVLRAADAIESYDRLLTDVLQADLAQVSVRQNRAAAGQAEDVRKISAWAAIALVPTAIAGVYGMNFDNMPELRTDNGYYVVLGVMAGVCVGLYALFRRNGWL